MSTVLQTVTHAQAFLKVESTYASAEHVRMGNTVNDIVSGYYRWHWNTTAGADINLSLGVQDYNMDAADQNGVLAIQQGYLTDATTTYDDLFVEHNILLPLTTKQGRPYCIGLLSPTQIRTYQEPDATYTLHWRYYKRPTVFAATSESFDCPPAFDSVVKTGMLWQFMSYADDLRAPEYQKTFYELLDNLKRAERLTAGRIK